MSIAHDGIRSHELIDEEEAWPASTRAVSYIASACVIEGTGDFTPQDLAVVRGRFPQRHVTLDGDVITVWPATLPAQLQDSHGR
ncbi:hypothetical protein HLK59_49795 [Streptomyces sp. S3(2020)]|uniref:hypothetical protein n=1 Tax=Streptomyces sp. S3(2020) TaxID=2732044 RepID=UPI001487CA2A|nr:hypothetical protein [Streptomyces sp. S3(2020)]NNN38257.1 hypothetical protein [Streptomyces sp. S3(2020)]